MSKQKRLRLKNKDYAILKLYLLQRLQEMPKNWQDNRKEFVEQINKELEQKLGKDNLPKRITDGFVYYALDEFRKAGLADYDKEYQEWEFNIPAIKEYTNTIKKKLGIEIPKTNAEIALEELTIASKNKATEEQTNNNKEQQMNNAEQTLVDAYYETKNENKIQKSNRNNQLLDDMLSRAQAFEADTITEDVKGQELIKVAERYQIRKQFSLETAEDVYTLYKEVSYIHDPKKFYAETVDQEVIVRVAKQHEHGNAEWALKVAEHENIEIVE